MSGSQNRNLVQEVLSLSGYQEVGIQTFLCTIKHNSEKIDPQLISEYTHLLVREIAN